MKDVRIRTSNRPTNIPASYRAFIYAWCGVDDLHYKVIIASDKLHADQLLRDWSREQGLESFFFRFVEEDDFCVCSDDSDYCHILL